MNTILVRKLPTPTASFRIRRVPFLGRFYEYVFCSQSTGRIEMWSKRILRKIFPAYYRLCGSSTGEFEFQRQGQRSEIQFNARNTEFCILSDTLFKNGYEIEVAALLDVLLPEGGTFFDVGSNWGYHTLLAAGSRSKLTVHAFEPTPETFKDLVACVEQSGLAGMVTCNNFALSSNDGKAFIKLPEGLHSGGAQVSSDGGVASINTRRLDSLDLPKPDFIKMDVEGHEIEVVKGGQNTLKLARPYLVFESKPNHLQPDKVLDIFFFLARLGYNFFVPAIQREPRARNFLIPAGWLPAANDDGLALIPFIPEMRLLCLSEFNVFACHESRLPELMTKFKPWP
jgi:FkbM family methyltransferase